MKHGIENYCRYVGVCEKPVTQKCCKLTSGKYCTKSGKITITIEETTRKSTVSQYNRENQPNSLSSTKNTNFENTSETLNLVIASTSIEERRDATRRQES